MTNFLADPLLRFGAENFDTLEANRIAFENRYRQLTRGVADSDGIERGFNLPEMHPDVMELADRIVELKHSEHQAGLHLDRRMKTHGLYPWVKDARGVGTRQAARLLAAIGDPYWNDLHNRPRLVSELWSYCGYGDAEKQVKRRGHKATWSHEARMRGYLIAVSIVKSGGPYRKVYDDARTKYEDALHKKPCVRCGPSGKPAAEGTPLSNGHKHARALRAAIKEVLRDMWIEAARLHREAGDYVEPAPRTERRTTS